MIDEARMGSNDSVSMTDGVERGCSFPELVELTTELTQALDRAFVAFLLAAELEDAFDVALFRASRDAIPACSGGDPFAIW